MAPPRRPKWGASPARPAKARRAGFHGKPSGTLKRGVTLYRLSKPDGTDMKIQRRYKSPIGPTRPRSTKSAVRSGSSSGRSDH